MKVILLSGSPRKGGNTEQALNICAEAIRAAGVEAEVISLAGKDIRGCKACYACRDKNKCVMDDGLNEIIEKVKDAEGFIVGAPVYYGTARGDVMNAIQRIACVAGGNGKWLSGKVGGPVIVARRGGHTATLQEMLMHCFICGMVVPGSSYWNMMFGRNPGEINEDEEGVNTIKNFGTNVAEVIKKLNA